MKKRRKIQWQRLAIVAAAAVVGLGAVFGGLSALMKGCGSEKEPPSQLNEAQPVTIGEQTSDTQVVKLENQTGQAIISFKVKKADAADYSENLLGSQRIKNKATAVWYFKPEADTHYDVEVTLANYAHFVLRVWPFDKFSGLVTILYKNDTGYLEYTPKGDSSSVNTLQDEQNAEQTRKEEAARKEQEEQQRQQQAQLQQQAQQEQPQDTVQEQVSVPEETVPEPAVPEPAVPEEVYPEEVYPAEEEQGPVYDYDENGNPYYVDENGEIVYV